MRAKLQKRAKIDEAPDSFAYIVCMSDAVEEWSTIGTYKFQDTSRNESTPHAHRHTCHLNFRF